MSWKNYFVLGIFVLLALLLIYLKIRERILPVQELVLVNQVLTVEIAQTPFAWAKGLGGRDSLAENKGLLFVFPQADRRSFWMKDMKIPIDIIWINEGKVIDIAPNIQPSMLDPLPTYMPRLPARFVLEVKAGFSQKNSLKIGDEVEMLTK